MIFVFVLGALLLWIGLIPVLIAVADRPETRRTDPVPAMWIARGDIPSLANYHARVVPVVLEDPTGEPGAVGCAVSPTCTEESCRYR